MAPLSGSLRDLADRLRREETTPTALLEAHIRRIREVDVALNAVAARRFDVAREEARRAEEELAAGEDRGPLHGIPCTVKEFLAVEGLPHTGGLYVRRRARAEQDATIVTRLKDAGAVIVASTNAPEGGLWHETNNRVYGRTANPHDLNRTAGGSSGGEGAIIAAGGSPFGIGSDVGGSIRLPAGFCGIYGHKPTHTLVPNTGHFPEAPPEPYMTCGPLARSASDLFPILDAIAGPDGEDPLARPWELRPPEVTSVERLRVFVAPTNGQASVSAPMQEAVRRAGRILARSGATVETVEIPELAAAFDIWAVLLGDLGVPYEQLVTDGGSFPLSKEVLRWTRGRSRHTGAVIAMVGLQRILDRLPDRTASMAERARRLNERIETLLGDDGVLLHPTFARVAPRHRTIGIGNPADIGLTAVFNILGLPITVAPIGTHQGLPTSVQIIGPAGADGRTIAVAQALEAATGGWSPVEPRRGPAPRTLFGRLR